jgi:hypothetical protein
MIPSLQASIEALTEAITDARSELAVFHVSAQHYYLEHALAGYLWNAIATSDTIRAVLHASAALGAEPLKRYLHECYLDVLFLVSDPEPDLLAAKCFLTELTDSRRLVQDYRKVVTAHPDIDLPELPASAEYFATSQAEAVERLDTANAAMGGAPALFARAAAAWNTHRHWHWSGVSRPDMVRALVARSKLTVQDQLMANSLTKIYNAGAHASPAWAELPFPECPGTLVPVEPPGTASESVQAQLGSGTLQFLVRIVHEIRLYRASAHAA